MNLILEKWVEEMGITSSLMNPEHITLFKSRVEQILKEVYPEYQDNIKLKLDQSTRIGNLTVNNDSLLKPSSGHSCISAIQKFSKGINTWKVQLTERVGSATEDWLMIGVLNRAKAESQSSYSDNNCFGVAVNTSCNGGNYEYIGGGKVRNHGKFLISYGDIITVTLNMDLHKLITNHQNWESQIDLPTDIKEWYPHFNVYSMLFKLI